MAAKKTRKKEGRKPLLPIRSSPVQTIDRVSLLLEVLAQAPAGISLGELAARVRLPKGTTHRLLSSLAFFGFARQDPESKKYFLGYKVVELGQRVLNQLDLRREARPFLMDLAEKTRETVHLVLLDRQEVLYLDRVEADEDLRVLRTGSKIGTRTTAHSSAVGKVLLAHLPGGQFEDFIRQKGLPCKTPKTITNPNDLRRHLRMVRDLGYAVDDEENEEGVRCVAAPLRDESGAVVAAISISGPSVRMTPKLIRDSLNREVREAALKISAKLGFRQPMDREAPSEKG
ncbi:MAG: IclR family transcriptional regulator [Syntrophaceae bacterium]|nr:IclR family transcriptional regulator [Syntrophaceae bacterium]